MVRFFIAFIAAAAITSPAFAQGPKCATGNPVVWVNTASKIYYMKGSTHYGQTKLGKFVCRNTAQAMGARADKSAGGSTSHGKMSPRMMMSPGPMSSAGSMHDPGSMASPGAMSSTQPMTQPSMGLTSPGPQLSSSPSP